MIYNPGNTYIIEIMHCYYALVQVIQDGCTWCNHHMGGNNAASWKLVKPLLEMVPIESYRAHGNIVDVYNLLHVHTYYVYTYIYIYIYIRGYIYIYIYIYLYDIYNYIINTNMQIHN